MSAGDGAREQLAWVVAAFRGADPGEDEVVAHFDERFLTAVPPSTVLDVFRSRGGSEFEVFDVTEVAAGSLVAGTSDGFVLSLTVEPEPPHRIRGLLLRSPEPESIDDERLVDPPVSVSFRRGEDPERGLRERFASQGHVGLAAAAYRSSVDESPEVLATVGWADLQAGDPVTPGHRFPAYSVTKLLTVVAVLQLVAADRVALDQPANDVLTSFQLWADDVTIRELLTHTGGVSSDFAHWVDEVGPAADLLGPLVPVARQQRGRHVYSNGGYTTLGQIVADVSGRSYEVFVTEEVLRPLGMVDSDFPMVPPWPAPGVATGHEVSDGRIVTCARQICSVPPAGGLWSTLDDLARFAFDWPTLLPEALVVEALRPQVERAGGGPIGLGFLLFEDGWGHAGGGIGYSSSLLCRPAERKVAVAFANRSIPVEPIAFSVLDRVG